MLFRGRCPVCRTSFINTKFMLRDAWKTRQVIPDDNIIHVDFVWERFLTLCYVAAMFAATSVWIFRSLIISQIIALSTNVYSWKSDNFWNIGKIKWAFYILIIIQWSYIFNWSYNFNDESKFRDFSICRTVLSWAISPIQMQKEVQNTLFQWYNSIQC